MTSRRALRAIACVLLFPLAGRAHLFSQETDALPGFTGTYGTEAGLLARMSGVFATDDPTSLYSFSVQDKEVEFLLDGTWEVDLTGSITIDLGGTATSATFTPPVFSQRVDLSSWLFIDKTWYFESSFAEEFTRNTVAAGYLGRDDDPIRHVRLGNSGISFPDHFTFIDVGGGDAIAPGVMGSFGGKNWDASAIVRYDTAARRELRLSGMNEVSDEMVDLADAVTGKWFALPVPNVTGVPIVYVEDENGSYTDGGTGFTGRRWRRLDEAEYRLYGVEGILELVNETAKGVAISYASLSSPTVAAFVSDTSDWFDDFISPGDLAAYALSDPTRFMTTIDGSDALLLRERGRFSPFVVASRYRSSGTDLSVVNRNTDIPVHWLSATRLTETYAEIARTDAYAVAPGILAAREVASRFPLFPDYPRTYLPSKDEATGLEIRSRSYKPVSSIALGDNAIAGTITVVRDGITDRAFTFDQTSGLVTLLNAPRDGETVVISWLDTDSSARNATVTTAAGIRWFPVKNLALSLATALKWNVSDGGFTDSSETSPGSFVVSAGADYRTETLSAKTAFALELGVSDTTGFYRVYGMDDEPLTLYPAKTWYKEISPSIEPTVETNLLPAEVLLTGDYAEPNGVSGEYLPSIDSSSSVSAVLDLSVSLTSTDAWSAGDILMGDLGSADLRGARTVSVRIRNLGSRDDYDVFLQLGARAEDYYEDPATVRTWQLETPSSADGWVVRTVTLTDGDRASLSAGQNARLIVRSSAATLPAPSPLDPLAIRLASAEFEIRYSSFQAAAEPDALGGDGVTLAERADAHALTSFAPEPVRRFNASGINRVLELTFAPEATTDRVVLTKYVEPIPLASYRYLSFFLFAEDISSLSASDAQTVRIALTRPRKNGQGYLMALDAEFSATLLNEGDWHRVTVDLFDRRILIDGTEVSAALGRVTSLDTDESPTRIELSFVDLEAPPPGETYRLAVDELYLEEARRELVGKNRTEVSWKRDGAIVSAGSHAILSNPSLSVATDAVAGDEGTQAAIAGTARASANILFVLAEGSVAASSSSDRAVDSAGYTVTAPVGALTLREYYFADFPGDSFRRDDSAALSWPFPIRASTGVSYSGGTLERTMAFSLEPSTGATRAGVFSVATRATFAQTGNSPRGNIENDSWQALWADTVDYSLSFGAPDALKRSGTNSLTMDWTTPWKERDGAGLDSIKLDVAATSRYTAVSSVSISSALSSTLSFPISLGSSTLTPTWKRIGTDTGSLDAGGSYLTDSERLYSDIGKMGYYFMIPPIYDLVANGMPERIRDESDGTSRAFSNRYGIDWTRRLGGGLSDLWIPSTVSSWIMRESETDAVSDDELDVWSASVRAGFTALNVAGSMSPRALFTWYEQDEFSQLYGWSARWGSSYFTWSVDTWHSALLFFAKGGTVSLENAFHYTSPSIAGSGELTRNTVSFVWKRPIDGSFLTSIVDRWTDLPLSTRREDTASVGVANGDDLSITISWKHVLATGIGKNGEVTVTTGVIYTNSELVETVELSVGVGGKLTY